MSPSPTAIALVATTVLAASVAAFAKPAAPPTQCETASREPAGDPPWLSPEWAQTAGDWMGSHSEFYGAAPHANPHGSSAHASHETHSAHEDPHAGLGIPPAYGPHGSPADTAHPASTAERSSNPHAHARILTDVPSQQPTQAAKSTASNGLTVAEAYSKRKAWTEKSVRVRGIVTKRTTGVMGTNFVHLRDGTGDNTQQTNDLTITMAKAPELGSEVEVEGTLVVDRDLGFGYSYEVLIDNAVRVD